LTNYCNNWRGIILLSIPSKVFCIVLISRNTEAVDKKQRQEQAGFRKGRGCIDHIFVLRNILEQCYEWQRKLPINFVDFEKAFESLQRDSIWQSLRNYGISSKIVQIIKQFFTNFSCTIKVITKLPNSEQSYKGKVKTHNYINRQNQSTTGKL
jgi:hypothetical protein